jgi:hypothetical protein
VYDPTTGLDVAQVPEEAQFEQRRNELLPPLSSVANLDRFEALAQQVFGANGKPWSFFSSFADDGYSEALRIRDVRLSDTG